jgi:hypothetical protein
MNKLLFLSKGSVNTFLQKLEAYKNTVTMKTGVLYVICAEELKRRELGHTSSVVS